MANNIFVFGSNLSGYHGAGSAKAAVEKYGAIYGQGVGLQGQSYAIPTKDFEIKSLSLREIRPFVDLFLQYAAVTPDNEYHVVEIGCGLAGFKAWQIAPMFTNYTPNVHLTPAFKSAIREHLRQIDLHETAMKKTSLGGK